VAELSRGEGDYRESASVLRLPKPLRFFRCVQFVLDSLGVGIELKIPRVHKACAGSIPASGTNFKKGSSIRLWDQLPIGVRPRYPPLSCEALGQCTPTSELWDRSLSEKYGEGLELKDRLDLPYDTRVALASASLVTGSNVVAGHHNPLLFRVIVEGSKPTNRRSFPAILLQHRTQTVREASNDGLLDRLRKRCVKVNLRFPTVFSGSEF